MTQRTIEFDLKYGFVDKDDRVHKHVVMCAIKTKHFIAVNSDVRIRSLMQGNFKMNITAALMLDKDISKISNAESMQNIEVDPVKMQIAQGAYLEYFSILFPHIVLSIGDIQAPKKCIFEDLETGDMAILQKHYEILNCVDRTMLKSDEAGKTESPKEPEQ
jgi:hypothetical protein